MAPGVALAARGPVASCRYHTRRSYDRGGMRKTPGVFERREKSIGEVVRATTSRAKRSGGPVRTTPTCMPVGVPKVPYKAPGESSSQWVDLWNVMYRERILYLSKPIDDEIGNQLVGTLLFLDSENQKDMYIYICQSAGDVVPTMAIHDTMKAVRSDVATVAFGGAQAMPAFLLACGKKGKRAAFPNTTIMLHHPSGVSRGSASDMINEARELMRIRAYMNTTLSEATGQSVETISRDLMRDKYMDTKQAVEYGVIDKVLYPRKLKV